MKGEGHKVTGRGQKWLSRAFESLSARSKSDLMAGDGKEKREAGERPKGKK